MDNQSNQKVAQIFAGAFAASFSDALTRATGTTWQVEVEDNTDSAMRPDSPVHYRVAVDGAVKGDCFVELYEPHVINLAARLASPAEAEPEEQHIEALRKLIAAAAPGLSLTLASHFGDLTFKVERVSSLTFGGMFVVPLAAADGEGASVPMLLYFDNQLQSGLVAKSDTGRDRNSSLPHFDPVNLRLVMDVELNVTLRFGQRQMPLRDVLELTSGSVIELDRQVDEPVELLLDGRLIARGEAVIVDGNYGVRVTEIPEPLTSHFSR